jgi:hypothetical protein
MTEHEHESGEETIDEQGRNETQQRIDEEGASERPVDAGWDVQEAERDEELPRA